MGAVLDDVAVRDPSKFMRSSSGEPWQAGPPEDSDRGNSRDAPAALGSSQILRDPRLVTEGAWSVGPGDQVLPQVGAEVEAPDLYRSGVAAELSRAEACHDAAGAVEAAGAAGDPPVKRGDE